MASLVATNALFTVNDLALQTYASQITPNYGSESQDRTTFGGNTRIFAGGLKTWSFDVNFFWDNTTGGPEASLWSLIGTTSCVEYRNVNACTSVNNPSYTGVAVCESFNVGAQVGSMLTATARFVASGDLGRASSS